MDFRAFLLLGETINEIRRNSVFKNIPVRGNLFAVRETDFSAIGFYSIFQRLLSVFFRLVEKYFSTKSFIPAGGNRYSG